MGFLYDDVVLIRDPERPGDPNVITVNCPDKTGLGCDLCRIIFSFSLSIVKGDISTDGKWCYIVFWVVGRRRTRWGDLQKSLSAACPAVSSASGIPYYRFLEDQESSPTLFLLKMSAFDRRGFLHDVTEVLCELDLTIRRVKVSTTPDGKVMDLFYVSDTRELLHTKRRQDEVQDQLRANLGDSIICCSIESVDTDLIMCSKGPLSMPPEIEDELFTIEMPDETPHGSARRPANISVMMDNSLSPSHTLIQIFCTDHKGLLYDIMRTLKDYNIQISYGRFCTRQRGKGEVDLFVMQADGSKILDLNKQKALCSRLQMELCRPLVVAVVSRGPDTELLVVNPVELSGKGRPLVFYDITLALKMLNVCIFLAEIGRHVIQDREWEVYRILLDEGNAQLVAKSKVKEEVMKMLMGWN